MLKELQTYIQEARSLGHTDAEIEAALVDAGWEVTLVKGVLIEKKKKHRVFRVAFVTLAIIAGLALCVLYLPNLYNLIVFDESLIENDHLALQAIQIDHQENAFLDVEKLGRLVNLTREEDQALIEFVVRDKEVDTQFVKEVINKNQPAREFFSTMAEKPYFQDPNYLTPEITINEVTIFSPVRQVSRMLEAYSRLTIATGDYSAAIANSRALLKTGEHLIKGQNDTIPYLVGIALRTSGLRVAQMIIDQTEDPQIISQVQMYLSEFPFERPDYDRQVRFQYQSHIKLIELLSKKDNQAIALWYGDTSNDPIKTFKYGIFSPSLVTQLNKTINLYTKHTDTILNQPGTVCDLVVENPAVLPEPSVVEMLYAKNHLRNDFYNGFVSVVNSLAKKTCESEQLYQQILATNKPISR